MNASDSQQLEYVCIWEELFRPPESGKNGAHFLEMKRIRKQRAWCCCDSVGLLCAEGGGRDGALMENEDRCGVYTSAAISDAWGEETINTR